YSFERTIMFCLFSGNQFGLSGSKEFVGSLTSNNKIGNIINLDMIGYQDPEVSFNVGVFPTPNKFDFYDNFQKIQSLYVPKIELRSDATYKQANSDINNFWDNGFEGISLSESYLPGYNENPYKNTENDLLTTSVNSPEKWELTTKLAIASLITYAKLVNTSGIAENESFVNEVNNYPNPFNGTTHINFQISKSSNISLFIYDIYGNEVKRIKENEFMTSGNYSIEFDASEIASGIYFYQIKTETNQISKKMIIN
ncbi:MAG TPA: T9SS type A sorting domain-containing protein, partial [Bacteroidales bacterium]|nr:T9SS type A sorting domain-containing protein [Bacteroidales bacterium]